MVKELVEHNMQKSISYNDYKELVAQLVEEHGTTGNDKSDAMVNYTVLNNRRMKRWDKTVKLTHDAVDKVINFDGDVTWLVLTESWCGDAAHVIPVMNKIADLNKGIDLKLILRDENDELMNQFLTNGGRAIPKLIMIDNKSGEILNTYGPRPSEATKLVDDYKKMHGELTPEFKEDLQRWYNKNKGQNIIEDLVNLIDS